MNDENATSVEGAPESRPAVERSSLPPGSAYRGSDGAVTCCLCDSECEWEECSSCGGDGGFDGYEEDPLWYHPGEMAPCPSCNSQGGSYWCPNDDCKNGEIVRIYRSKPNARAETRNNE